MQKDYEATLFANIFYCIISEVMYEKEKTPYGRFMSLYCAFRVYSGFPLRCCSR